MIRADALRILDEPQAAGGIRLRIAIDEERVDFSSRKGSGQVDGGRSLADATLLVGNSDYASHEIVRRSRALAAYFASQFNCNEEVLCKERIDVQNQSECSCRNISHDRVRNALSVPSGTL